MLTVRNARAATRINAGSNNKAEADSGALPLLLPGLDFIPGGSVFE